MAAQKDVANYVASYFFETKLIDRFKECFEEEIAKNPDFQAKLLELSTLECDGYQGNESFLKRLIQTNKDYQFDEMKENLFRKFNIILNEIMKSSVEDT